MSASNYIGTWDMPEGVVTDLLMDGAKLKIDPAPLIGPNDQSRSVVRLKLTAIGLGAQPTEAWSSVIDALYYVPNGASQGLVFGAFKHQSYPGYSFVLELVDNSMHFLVNWTASRAMGPVGGGPPEPVTGGT